MLTRFYLSAALTLLTACAADAAPGRTPGSPVFDGQAAYGLVETQVEFGPRVPGTAGHERQLDWMLARLDSLAPDLVADTFPYVTTYGDSLPLVNVLARYRPELERRVLVLAHWDTRPTSDEAGDAASQALPLPGANDGASGTAILLELARLMASEPPPMGVDLLFVDGEDYGPTPDDMFLGAERYAERLPLAGEGIRPIYGVLLDMVGDSDPSFPIEGNSAEFARVVVQKVWRAAARLGYEDVFPESVGIPLGDDHIPLIEAGLLTANVIDFTYGGPLNPYWHTPQDIPSNVSASTLAIVGEVMIELIYSGG